MDESSKHRAAQYLRMSTDHQDLSPEMQKVAIQAYAQREGLEVVQTYLDAGKSGLTLHKRPAMKQLLQDVTCSNCKFSTILVYDISRWGRFQDTDASAYYEYHCRLNHVTVRYVQEPFSGAESLMVTLFKGMKRVMAAEFSRELSVKVIAGQKAAIRAGFQLGTLPCLGFDRVAVSKTSGSKRTLGRTEHKAGDLEHVKWVLGSQTEIDLIREIFSTYANSEITMVDLVKTLQARSITTRNGRPITPCILRNLLQSEAVIGNFVWGRSPENERRRKEGDERILRSCGFVEPIVPVEIFNAVQRRLGRHGPWVAYSRDMMVKLLRAALVVDPCLRAIDLPAHGCPSNTSYARRFGSIRAAWVAAGFTYDRATAKSYVHKVMSHRVVRNMCNLILSSLTAAGVECEYPASDRGRVTLLIKGKVLLRVQVIRQKWHFGSKEWVMKKVHTGPPFDWALLVRMRDDGTPFDSILLKREEYYVQSKWTQEELKGEWIFHHTISSLIGIIEGSSASESDERTCS